MVDDQLCRLLYGTEEIANQLYKWICAEMYTVRVYLKFIFASRVLKDDMSCTI